MAYFPFFIELKDKKCLIFGGGLVAYRKVMALLEFDADITVVAPVICEDIMEQKDRITIVLEEYREEHIKEAYCVIAATNHPEVNSQIAKASRDRKILVNVVDELDQCDFLFPAYVKRGSISIGVTTGGKSPIIAGKLRKSIQENMPDYYEELVNTLGSYREYIKNEIPTDSQRAVLFKELAEIGIRKKGNLSPEDVKAAVWKVKSGDGFNIN